MRVPVKPVTRLELRLLGERFQPILALNGKCGAEDF